MSGTNEQKLGEELKKWSKVKADVDDGTSDHCDLLEIQLGTAA